MPQSIPWKILNQRHDSYDALRTRKLQLLLEGGFEITKTENAKLFISKWNNETNKAYSDRLRCSTYENNFGEIINDYGACLFVKPMMVQPAADADDEETPGEEPDENEPFMQLQMHFDLQGRSAAKFMHCKQTESNALSCAYFGMDFEGKKPYAYDIDPNSMLDWQKDEANEFIFVILKDDQSIRTKVSELRDHTTTTFIIWTKENEQVKYEVYQITYLNTEPPQDETMVSMVESRITDFTLIPIVECHTPDNLAVGKVIGQLAASHFVRYSSLIHALNRASTPILTYKQGAEISADGDLSVINEDEDRGSLAVQTARAAGSAVIGPNDEITFAEVRGDCLKIFQEQLTQDKNEMYRLVSQLGAILTNKGTASTTTKASGTAKQMDNQSKENMLNAYAELVKQWIIKAFTIVFSAKNFQQDVVWQVKGMDNYQVVDEDQMLAKVAALPSFKANIPSPTSYKQVLLDTASEMHPFTNPGTLAKIREEILEAVDAMDATMFGKGDGYAMPPPDNQLPQAGQPTKPASTTASQAAGDVPDEMALAPSGQPLMPEGSHLQTGEHIDAMTVYNILAEDYQDKDIQFVKHIPWTGPVAVPLSSIDNSNMDNWSAAQPEQQDHVNMFADKLSAGEMLKPIILVNNKSNDNKYQLIDGHHRYLASLKNGQPVDAYIGEVGMDDGPWTRLHAKQNGSQQESSQQTSQQKEVSKQVSASEKAKNGKTK